MTRLQRWWTLAALLALGLLGTAGLAAQDETFKGKVRIGHHRQMLQKGTLYHFKVAADGFRPRVGIRPGYFIYLRSDDADVFQAYLVPRETRDHTLVITPDLFDELGDGPLKYTATITPVPLAAKPLLAEKARLTDQDPIYRPEFDNQKKCRFKAYPVRLKAGRAYVIDMERSDENMDPYLYLEGPDRKIVAQDDDGAGDLNARLIFRPRRDGQYRVIATTLAPATGEFRLTVREEQKE